MGLYQIFTYRAVVDVAPDLGVMGAACELGTNDVRACVKVLVFLGTPTGGKFVLSTNTVCTVELAPVFLDAMPLEALALALVATRAEDIRPGKVIFWGRRATAIFFNLARLARGGGGCVRFSCLCTAGVCISQLGGLSLFMRLDWAWMR